MKAAVSQIAAIFGLVTASAGGAETNFNGGNWLNGPVEIAVDVSGATAEGSAESAALLEAARAAAAKWNATLNLSLLRIKPASLPDRMGGNGRNELIFSKKISPDASFSNQFGSVALRRGVGGRLVECDLIFNPDHRWLVYRGPLEHEPNGDRVPDFYRVALHEFGHLLGFEHPASDEQFTVMRSVMTDVDDLTPGDLRDARLAAKTLALVNSPRLSAPQKSRSSVAGRKISVRGSANPFFTSALTIEVRSAHGVRRYRLRPGATWRKGVALQPGRNRLRFFYRQPDGSAARFAIRYVIAR